MTRVGRVPVDSTSEAEGKATLTGSLVNVYGLWMPEEWLGIWGIAGFGTGASDLTTVDGRFPDESLLSWLGAAGQRAELWSGGDAQRGLGAEAGAELRYTHTACCWCTTLTWAPADHGAGPSVSVAPSWGRPASGMDALWRDPSAVLASHGGAASARDRSWLPDSVDVTVSYGLDGLELEVFGRHLAGNGDAGYRFGLGGSLEY